MKKMDNKLKIRDFCGDYALDIPFADGSVNTIYFNSKRNAETVKHIIEVDGSKPNEATVCDMREIKHAKWIEYKYKLKCSNCNTLIDIDDIPETICVNYCSILNYCPICGAKMDSERND